MPLLIVLSATHIILLSYIIIPILQRRQTPRPAFFLNIGACRNLGFAGVMLDHVHSAHGQQTCVVSTWTYIYIYIHTCSEFNQHHPTYARSSSWDFGHIRQDEVPDLWTSQIDLFQVRHLEPIADSQRLLRKVAAGLEMIGGTGEA